MCQSSLDPCQPLNSEQIAENKHIIDEAVRYAPYAICSNNSYDKAEKALPMPKGWREEPTLRTEDVKTGFAYAVFEKQENGNLAEVVVAFRGTDQIIDFIKHNLIPFYRTHIPPAQEGFKKTQEAYKDRNAKFTVTGHSLGGGLAFNIAFTHRNVDAIVFNASPITKAGWYPIKTNTRISIWESGDILRYFRDFINVIRPRWRGTQRIKFNFQHGSPIKQHGIYPLALNMIKLGSSKSPELDAVLRDHCKHP